MMKISHFKLGLFFLVCVGIVLGGLVWIGASQLFRHTKTYVTVFNESVAGLNQGAAINYLGLQVGKVSALKLAPDGKLVLVFLEFQPDFTVNSSMAVHTELAGITGQKNIAIGKAPANIRQVTPAIDFPLKYPVIPSYPGQIDSVETAMKNLYQKLESVDIEGLAAAWKETALRINRIALEKDLPETLRNVKSASADLRALVAELRQSGAIDDLQRGARDFAAVSADARKAGADLKKQVDALPPGAVAHFAQRMQHMADTGESAVASLKVQLDQSVMLLQQTLFKTNRVLGDTGMLVDSLKEDPGRIMVLPANNEPFRR